MSGIKGKEVGYMSGFDEYDYQQGGVTYGDPFNRALSGGDVRCELLRGAELSRD